MHTLSTEVVINSHHSVLDKTMGAIKALKAFCQPDMGASVTPVHSSNPEITVVVDLSILSKPLSRHQMSGGYLKCEMGILAMGGTFSYVA